MHPNNQPTPGRQTSHETPTLNRTLSLTLVILYGLGVTIGAGIYVLIGATAAKAGIYAPSSFILAAFVMVFTAGSFAELSSRFPASAGEAVYVNQGFNLRWLTLLTGGLVILSAVVAAATITLGCAGYVLQLLDIPHAILVSIIVIAMAMIAAWGILESVLFASVLTVLEIAGLLVIVVVGLWNNPEIALRLPEVIPSLGNASHLAMVFSASLIAFFAFIGFDDVVNLAEETRNPVKVMPKAIFVTLILVTVIYFMVVSIAVLTMPVEELAASSAPIGLLFERLTGTSPLLITLIAIVATINGIVIQIIMASRVLYGMGRQGSIPKVFAKVNSFTRTPVFSTAIVSITVLVLALYFPLENLAEATSRIILIVFALVNLALIRVKRRGREIADEAVFNVGIWVPAIGAVTCLLLFVGPLFID